MKISIIIPTLDEETHIERTITAIELDKHPSEVEIIVIDAGSCDKTVERTLDLGHVLVVEKPEFKGKKYASLNFGASLATGDVLLFLDADTILPRDFYIKIRGLLDSDSRVVGGAFEHQFDHANFSLWLIQLINRVRYRISRLYYGDQAIFCRKQAFLEVGGFVEAPIMEAAYLCKSLKTIGKLKLIKHSIKTSSRRFVSGGVWKVFLNDTRIWLRDSLGLDNTAEGQRYWESK
ncbi:MAG: glycosyltransferase [Cyclobacteriaceae bacterium]